MILAILVVLHVCSNHFADGRPTAANPIPTINMGYNLTETPKPRRKLVRRPLFTPKENIPPNEENFDNKLIATLLFDNEIVNDNYNNYVVSSQCDAICCIKYPNLCKNVALKVDSSTQTEYFVKLDHPYVYEMSTKSVGTQRCFLFRTFLLIQMLGSIQDLI